MHLSLAKKHSKDKFLLQASSPPIAQPMMAGEPLYAQVHKRQVINGTALNADEDANDSWV